MKSPIVKKQLLLSVLVIALGDAVYLNYFFSGAQVTPTGGSSAETSNAGDRHLGDSVFVSGKTSTPPESAHSTFLSPIFALSFAIVVSAKFAIVHSPFAWQIS